MTQGQLQANPLAHPLSIGTDGSGTVLEGERERYIVEFVDPGKRTAPAVNLAGLGLDEGAQLDSFDPLPLVAEIALQLLKGGRND